MSLLLDTKYLRILSSRLRNFKNKGNDNYQFSCPICGDSAKDKHKARGYVFAKNGSLRYYCHNCNWSGSFTSFLRAVDPAAYKDFSLDTIREHNVHKKEFDQEVLKERPVFQKAKYSVLPCKHIMDLSVNHYARKYVLSRQVPTDEIYYTKDFKKLISDVFPESERIEKLVDNEERIVFALRDEQGEIIGIQGRALDDYAIRYMSIKRNESDPKVFGLDKLKKDRTIFVLEGVFDALMLHNAVAMLDGALYTAPMVIGHGLDYIFVFDNEPRNKQIVDNMKRTIELGHKIFIWPAEWKDYKDLNEAVLDGVNRSAMQIEIERRAYSGVKASMKLSEWRNAK